MMAAKHSISTDLTDVASTVFLCVYIELSFPFASKASAAPPTPAADWGLNETRRIEDTSKNMQTSKNGCYSAWDTLSSSLDPKHTSPACKQMPMSIPHQIICKAIPRS
jgi:hypothetical protein